MSDTIRVVGVSGSPTDPSRTTALVRRVTEAFAGELAGHEAELDERAGAGVEDGVEDLVDVRERVDGLLERRGRAEAAAVGRAVHEHVVVEDAVEPDVAGPEHLHGLAEVVLPVDAQRLVGPARAEALVPDVPQLDLSRGTTVDQ